MLWNQRRPVSPTQELSGIRVTPLKLDAAGAMPLRIGRHSGAECVTVAGRRDIKVSPPGTKPLRYKDHATTVWLAAESRKQRNHAALRPFGWVRLRCLSDSEGRSLLELAGEQERKRQEEIRIKAEQRRRADEARTRAKLKAEAERKRKDAEAKAVAEADRKLREQWESMTEEQREIALVQGSELARKCAPGVDVMQAVWPSMEKAEPEHQKALATAFKERWENDPGKWQKKKCSKKQWKKVCKLKEILGGQ